LDRDSLVEEMWKPFIAFEIIYSDSFELNFLNAERNGNDKRSFAVGDGLRGSLPGF
jgi:hypothetical protein